MRVALAAAIVAAACASGTANAPPVPADCNTPAPTASLSLDVPGNPFQALPSGDGCWIFVSIGGQPPVRRGIGVYRRAGGTVSLAHFANLPTAPSGMALTHDGRMLIVAAGDRVTFLDVDQLITGRRAIL